MKIPFTLYILQHADNSRAVVMREDNSVLSVRAHLAPYVVNGYHVIGRFRCTQPDMQRVFKWVIEEQSIV